MCLRLRGLERRGTYLVENRDRPEVMRMSGRKLMEAGLEVQVDQPRQSGLICCRRVADPNEPRFALIGPTTGVEHNVPANHRRVRQPNGWPGGLPGAPRVNRKEPRQALGP